MQETYCARDDSLLLAVAESRMRMTTIVTDPLSDFISAHNYDSLIVNTPSQY